MKFTDIEMAFDFVNSASPFEHSVYISKSTGETYWQSDMSGMDELPDDLDESDDYLEVPHGQDLGLGTRVVWDFVRQHIPHLHDQVQEAFSRKGAYSRFKGLLERNGCLEKWHRYEGNRTRQALLEWCEANNLEVSHDESND
jgi:hypothetical protein